jgi:ABC-type Na+ efflux pump permease subunit
MDVLNTWGGGRNGLDSWYFSFVPVVPAAVAVGVKSLRNKRKTKYANAETQRLAEKYPEQDNSADQNTILQQLLAESKATLEQRNKSKGKKRAELTGKLRAYDEYIVDYQNTLSQLRASELKTSKIEIGNLYQGKPDEAQMRKIKPLGINISPTQTAPQDGVLGTASVGNQGTTKQMTTPDTTEMQGLVSGSTAPVKKDNTMLFVGIGIAVVVILMMRKS